MAKISNETKITITIIISIIVAFFAYRFMEDLPLFSGSKVIYTRYQKANGLTSGSYIYINGVKVGSVNGIKLLDSDSVRVTLNFNEGVNINKGSVAHLKSGGLLGDKAIYIKKGGSQQMVEDEETIKGEYDEGMFESLGKTGSKLSGDASQSFDKLNATLTQLQKIVDKGNREKIDNMLGDLNKSSHELSLLMQRKRGEMEKSIHHFHQLLANVDTVTDANKARIDSIFEGLDRSMDNLQQVSSDFKETNQKLNSILTKLNEGKGSMGKLVNDPSLYNHMDSLSVELSKLIKNINRDPAKYLKGLKLIDVF